MGERWWLFLGCANAASSASNSSTSNGCSGGVPHSVGRILGRVSHRYGDRALPAPDSILINRTVKLLLHRVRPHLWQSPAPELDYGFPSGHAMSSMTLVAALVILTWRTRWRWLVLVVGGLFVLAIGWTRLYLGVHYPSDVLAAWTVSIAWAVGVSLLIKPHAINLH